MNELLAIILLVFDTERVENDNKDWDKLSEKEIADSHLIEFLFDPKFVQADVFMAHDRMLQLGI
jgi:hypothetical protein